MEETMSAAGGCLCGVCRYASRGAPINIRACHCRRCQTATGSPFYARVMVPLDSVMMTGPIRWYDAGTGVRRGFCPECGTTLFSERQGANTIGLTMGSLDRPDSFSPSEHIWTASKQRWIALADGLPQYEASFPPDRAEWLPGSCSG